MHKKRHYIMYASILYTQQKNTQPIQNYCLWSRLILYCGSIESGYGGIHQDTYKVSLTIQFGGRVKVTINHHNKLSYQLLLISINIGGVDMLHIWIQMQYIQHNAPYNTFHLHEGSRCYDNICTDINNCHLIHSTCMGGGRGATQGGSDLSDRSLSIIVKNQNDNVYYLHYK